MAAVNWPLNYCLDKHFKITLSTFLIKMTVSHWPTTMTGPGGES
jgi:hypothetical protein